MFNDPRARRAWRHFRLRVELMLSSVSAGVRRELLDDLGAHVREMVERGPKDVGEFERLQAALGRIGHPREFLAPLLGEAIFRDPSRDIGFGGAGRAVLSLLSRGWHFAWRSALVLFAAVLGAVMLVLAVGSLIDPTAVGLFRVGSDDIQLRILGGEGGVPLAGSWLVVGLLALAAGSIAIAWRGARRLVLEILVNGASHHEPS
jgi:hypothetical protein